MDLLVPSTQMAPVCVDLAAMTLVSLLLLQFALYSADI